MSRHVNRETLLTVCLVAGLLVLVALRSNRWRVPSPALWVGVGTRRNTSKPEDAIYRMLDAARVGDTGKYVGAFTGPLREQLLQVIKEGDEAKFRRILIRQNANLQNAAITVLDRSNEDTVQARVEYMFAARNEVQDLQLTKDGTDWKISEVAGSQQSKTPVALSRTASE